MADGIRRGWLIIADISGYTAFLAEADLAVAGPLLDGLVGLLVEAMRAPLRLVKVEGDAVFGYADEDAVPDPMALVDRIEALYFAFRLALVNLDVLCVGAPPLDLKVALHFGQYAVSRPAGTADLTGRDVVLVHRLLKNRVIEATGVEAYLLATAPVMQRLPALGFTPHAETYAHLGEVALGVRDLAARYAEMRDADHGAVAADEALLELTYTVPAPPGTAWDWHIDGDKRSLWDAGNTGWVLLPDETGRVAAGAGVRCEHDDGSHSTLRITGWRPYRSMTVVNPRAGLRPAVRLSYAFEQGPGGDTRVRMRVGRLPGILGWLMGWLVKRAMGKLTRRSVPLLTELLRRPPLGAG